MKETLRIEGKMTLVNMITNKVELSFTANFKRQTVQYDEMGYYIKLGNNPRKFWSNSLYKLSFNSSDVINEQIVSIEKENEVMNETTTTSTEMNETATLNAGISEIPSSIKETVELLLDESKLAEIMASSKKTVETVKFENKEMTVNADSREIFINAYNNAIAIGKNVQWAEREIITRTMDSPMYKSSFINDGDYADKIGKSKSYLSKARTAVRIRDWLVENGYGENWNATAVEELVGMWNDLKKKKISFTQFMQHSGLKEDMTVTETRKAIKTYKEAMTPKEIKKENLITSTSVANATVTSTSVANAMITSTSVPKQQLSEKKPYQKILIGNEMNISTVVDGETYDIWLNRETDKRLFDTIIDLIGARIKKAYEGE